MNTYKQVWAIHAPEAKTGDTVSVTLKSGKSKSVTLGASIGGGLFLEAESDITPAFASFKAKPTIAEYRARDRALSQAAWNSQYKSADHAMAAAEQYESASTGRRDAMVLDD